VYQNVRFSEFSDSQSFLTHWFTEYSEFSETMTHLAADFRIQDSFSPAGKFSDFGSLATAVVQILISFAFAISIIFIIIAGIKIVTASGDEKKLAAATGTLTYAIIGLVVTILAFVIVQVVQYLIGSSVAI